ncbi:CrtD protein [Rhizobium glycinendophyticum]|uniref:CrtD protein n=2 Tax=Rhizobium glycinendophyticum TaxID=2589807 RepID=A0A504U8H3_9HYPH|nr:CrtD protein [Rhizobium glycinendophyticum]
MRLAASGVSVTVIEAQSCPGGKLRQVDVGGRPFDAGPTVLTMKWVFEELMQVCGRRLEDEVPLKRAKVLARHFWTGGASLDLYGDVDESRRAIRDFAGMGEAEGFRRFAEDGERIYRVLKDSFIAASRPNPYSLSRRIGLSRPGDLLAIKPFSTLWSALSSYFADPRLCQLFGRYATYCGSSPFAAPATLMLVAHVEQEGVWMVEGGLHKLAQKLAEIAQGLGVTFLYGDPAVAITIDGLRKLVTGVETQSGRRIEAKQVLYNGDIGGLPKLLGTPLRPAHKPARSLSALIRCSLAVPSGVPLAHHSVFFSDGYEREFNELFREGRAPADPTIYLCAQDRSDDGRPDASLTPGKPERIYALMNLPANGDRHRYDESEIQTCLTGMERRLARNGLELQQSTDIPHLTTPEDFARLYPGSGGGLYGMPSHGWMASFQRPGTQGPVPGLYLAGGSVHPGPGIPMAALSGMLAAALIQQDRDSAGMSRRAVIAGGMPTGPAIAGNSPSR